MNIQIRLFGYLIILVNIQCLNFNLVPSFVLDDSSRYIGNFEGVPPYFLPIFSYFLC